MTFGIIRLRTSFGLLFNTYSYRPSQCFLNRCVYRQFRSSGLKHSNLLNEVSKKGVTNSKSSSEKDKLLFYNENPRFYRVLNIFGFVQFFFWVYMAEFIYNKMKDIEYEQTGTQNLPWWRKINFKDDLTRILTSGFCLLLGYGVIGTVWIYTIRSVRMLVLRKGGKTVTIVTFSPFGKTMEYTVPLEHMTTSQSRASSRVQLPIKVKDRWFYYMLDMKKGVFQNPQLFDLTAGMSRTLK